MIARTAGPCVGDCGGRIHPGDEIEGVPGEGWRHVNAGTSTAARRVTNSGTRHYLAVGRVPLSSHLIPKGISMPNDSSLLPAEGSLVYRADNGDPVTDSLIVADQTGNQHRAVIQLVRENLADLNEVGRVAFEMRPFETAGGRQVREVAVLDEPAAALLMTYLRIAKELLKDLWGASRDLYQGDARRRAGGAA